MTKTIVGVALMTLLSLLGQAEAKRKAHVSPPAEVVIMSHAEQVCRALIEKKFCDPTTKARYAGIGKNGICLQTCEPETKAVKAVAKDGLVSTDLTEFVTIKDLWVSVACTTVSLHIVPTDNGEELYCVPTGEVRGNSNLIGRLALNGGRLVKYSANGPEHDPPTLEDGAHVISMGSTNIMMLRYTVKPTSLDVSNSHARSTRRHHTASN